MTTLLEDFFVAVGFKLDDAGRRKTIETIAKIEKTMVQLGTVAAGVTAGMSASLLQVARAFDAVYYASQRTGSSVKELQSLKAAASQMGVSASEAQSAIEGMAQAVRENPGYKSLLKNLGASDTNDMTKALNQIAPRLAAMPLAQAEQFAKMLSIPENMLLAMRKVDEFRERQAHFSAKYGLLGFDPEKASKDARELSNSFTDLLDTFGKIGDKTASGLFRDLQPQIERLNAFLLAHGDEISKIMIKIGDALFKMFSYVVEHLPDIDKFAEKLGGWNVVLETLAGIISVAFVARLAGMVGSLRAISLLSMPPWALALLGIGAGAAVAAKVWTDPYGDPGAQKGTGVMGMRSHQHAREEDQGGPLGTLKRMWSDRPGWLGGGGDKTAISGSTFREKAPGIAKRLKADFGLSDEEAAAILGNLGHESAGFKAFAEGGNGPGRGWAQWTDRGRKARFFQYAADNKLDPKSDEANYGYLKWELQNSHKGSLTALRNAQGLEGKTMAFEGAYEGAGVKAYASRLGYAKSALDAIDKAGKALSGEHMGAPVPVPKMSFVSPTAPWAGNFNPDAMRSMFSAAPLGGTGINDNSRSVTIQDHSNTTINGVGDATAAASHIGRAKDRTTSMLIRNMQSAIG